MKWISTRARLSKWTVSLFVLALCAGQLAGCRGQSSRGGSSGSDSDGPRTIGAWRFVDGGGNRGLNADDDEEAKRPALLIGDEKLYGIWQEEADSKFQIRVASTSRSDPENWVFEDVDGINPDGINFDSDEDAVFPELISYRSMPFAAWHESTDTRWQVRLAAMTNPGEWQHVTHALIGEKNAPFENDRVISLAVFDELLVIAYVDRQDDGDRLEVLAVEFDEGAAPTYLVSDLGRTLQKAPDGVYYKLPNLEVHEGALHMTWVETADEETGGRIRVAKGDFSGVAPEWTSLLDEQESVHDALFTHALYPELLSHAGRLYLAWRENNSGINQVRLGRQSVDDDQVWILIDGAGSEGLNHDPARNIERTTIRSTHEGPLMAWEEHDGDAVQIIAAIVDPDSTNEGGGVGIEYIVGDRHSLNYDKDDDACRPNIAADGDNTFITYQLKSNGVWQVRVLGR